MKKLILIPIMLCAFVSISSSQTLIPQVMAFQGYVTSGDSGFTGHAPVTLTLWDSIVDGNEVWSQTWPDTVHIQQGYYSVVMDFRSGVHWEGNNSGFTRQYWLDANVNGQDLQPRVQLTSSPYSFRAQVADSARASDTASFAQSAAMASAAGSANNATQADKARYADSSAWSDSTQHSRVADSLKVPVPIGTVLAYAGSLAALPSGWLLCDGSSVRISDYPNYDAACGSIYGRNGSLVNLPDLRGLFLRGVNGTRTGSFADPDLSARTAPPGGTLASDLLGSYQTDAFQGHWHHSGPAGEAGAATPSANDNSDGPQWIQNQYTTAYLHVGAEDAIADASNHGTPRVSSETRPENAYIYWIIKVK